MSNQALDGITNPPIDALLDKAGSKYSLVLYAAKRARQINAYYSQLGEKDYLNMLALWSKHTFMKNHYQSPCARSMKVC
jgi:DNA-directed RNA polymerase omega subunit